MGLVDKLFGNYSKKELKKIEPIKQKVLDLEEKYQAMAKNPGLLISGGSDFHGAAKPHISIGTGTGNLRIPYSVLENIKKAKEQL